MPDERDERRFLAEQPLPPVLEGSVSQVSVDAGEAGRLPDIVSPHAGHRERLRQRFAASPDEAFPDYELLELILFRAIRRGDTKPLAKALLARFGSLGEVLGAPVTRLMEVKGVGEAAAFEIKLVAAAARRMIRSEIAGREILSSWEQVLDYCRAAMGFEEREQFRILFLDKKNALIRDEVQQVGTVDHTPVYPREVVKRALELAASAIVLVHKHLRRPILVT